MIDPHAARAYPTQYQKEMKNIKVEDCSYKLSCSIRIEAHVERREEDSVDNLTSHKEKRCCAEAITPNEALTQPNPGISLDNPHNP